MSRHLFTKISLLFLFGILGTGVAFAQPDILYSFPGGNGNGAPSGGLVTDSEGNLYGTTTEGPSQGVLFKLIPQSDQNSSETQLYSFAGVDGDFLGANMAIPTRDEKGNIYWTAPISGNHNCGIVFEASPQQNGSWKESPIYEFQANSTSDGCLPLAPLTVDGQGNLYGTTNRGGTSAGGGGTVFELSPTGGGKWAEKVIWDFDAPDSFNDPVAGGTFPSSALLIDSKGNLYGTAAGGQLPNGKSAEGIAFELSPQSGGAWKVFVLHAFGETASDGSYPGAGLTFDHKGNLYGTTSQGGGACSCGTVFELSPNGNDTWNETILHDFSFSDADGNSPMGGVILDSLGNLYGTTTSGGMGSLADPIVYQLVPQANSHWFERVISKFLPGDGAPGTTLVADAAGNLYGTTRDGGDDESNGSVFEIVEPNKTALPQITPAAGTYYSPRSIHISDATAGATIHFTKDGSTPTASSPVYTAPIQVAASETIKAIATAAGDKPSRITAAAYKIESLAATPEFSVKSGTYHTVLHVTLTSATPHAVFYYTLNGSNPPTSSRHTTGAITVSSTETIKAIAVAKGFGPSAVATASYTLHLPPAVKPVFSPNGGTFTGRQVVKLTDSTPGAILLLHLQQKHAVPKLVQVHIDGNCD